MKDTTSEEINKVSRRRGERERSRKE